ncbi:hypothetical protein ACHAXT_007775 [Thalassiosira profunda]
MCAFQSTPPALAEERSLQSDPTGPCPDMQSEDAANQRTIVRGRRRLKSALILYWSAALLLSSTLLFCPTANAFATGNRSGLSQRKSEWIQQSVQYYSTVMRKNAGAASQLPTTQMDSTTAVSSISEVPLMAKENVVAVHDEEFVGLATKHFYARHLIKGGRWDVAEKIYRRIIDELTTEDDNCDHTKLAVSTLLLALHLQRTGDVKATRAVFLAFFRRVALVEAEEEEEADKCACSAKVLQAYALFEMKNGHSAKSLEIIQRAVKMDEQISGVLKWKQFRDAAAGREYSPTFTFRKTKKFQDGGLAP